MDIITVEQYNNRLRNVDIKKPAFAITNLITSKIEDSINKKVDLSSVLIELRFCMWNDSDPNQNDPVTSILNLVKEKIINASWNLSEVFNDKGSWDYYFNFTETEILIGNVSDKSAPTSELIYVLRIFVKG